MKKKYIIPICKEFMIYPIGHVNLGEQSGEGDGSVKEDVWGDSNSNGSSMWDLYDDQLNK